MSYFAEGIMRQNMDPAEYDRNVRGMTPAEDAPAIAPTLAPAVTPAAEAPSVAAQPLTPEGADNMAKERQRFATAGISDEETSRLLGSPRQKLGG